MKAFPFPGFVLFALLVGHLINPATTGEVPTFARVGPSTRVGPLLFSFNGRSLDGFYTYTRYHQYQDPNRVFTVRDGAIRVSGEETGGFATRDSFTNYQLLVEWRWGGPTWYPRKYRARNSGIMIHCDGPDGDALASWMQSVECQIIEGGSGDLLVVPGQKSSTPPRLSAEVRIGRDGQPYFQEGGTLKTLERYRFNWWGRDPDWNDVLWFRGPNDVENPVGDWNQVEILCNGDSIRYFLNGVLVNQASRSSLTAGKILFQSEGAEILFRKIEIRPLTPQSEK